MTNGLGAYLREKMGSQGEGSEEDGGRGVDAGRQLHAHQLCADQDHCHLLKSKCIIYNVLYTSCICLIIFSVH